MSKRLTTEEFIEKAKKVHGDKYDYSKVEYKGSKIGICIICPEHGEFWQIPNSHLLGYGCNKCGTISRNRNQKMSQEEFIKRAKEVHGDKYDYSRVKYINSDTKVEIICPKHGLFFQTPNHHINRGDGCKLCGNETNNIDRRLGKDTFIKRSKGVHGDKYDYSKVEYINNKTKVCIICPEHGEFWQMPKKHLIGQGCPKCNYSQLEREVEVYLKSHDIDFIPQYKLDKQSLDFYLPRYNVGIECQGEQHFRNKFFRSEDKDKNEKKFQIGVERDIKKNKICEERGIKLFYYTNFDFIDKKSIQGDIYNKNNTFDDIDQMLSMF